MLCFVAWPTLDRAGVLYEYLSIALADMYSTGVGGASPWGGRGKAEGTREEGTKMDNT
jgi:hypothetical protein